MRIEIQLRILGDDNSVISADEVLHFDKSDDRVEAIGLSFGNAKAVLAAIEERQERYREAGIRGAWREHVKVWEIGGSSRRRRRIGWPLSSGNPWDEHAYRDPAPDRR